MWYPSTPKPQDEIKLRCDKTSDERLFKVGSIYNGHWVRKVNESGVEQVRSYYAPVDENGESYGTYGKPWFEFTIVEGPTEPPKE